MGFELVEPGIGEERNHRLAARLLTFGHLFPHDRRRELQPHVAEVGRARPARRQRAKIGRKKRRHLVHLECADEEEREIGGVGETLLVELHHLARVEARHVVELQRVRRVVIHRVDAAHAFREHRAGALRLIGQVCLEPLLEQRERCRILVWRGELEIGQLQRGLEVLRRARSADALRGARHRRRRVGYLPRQQFAEVGRREPTHSAQTHQRRRERRILVVGL